MSRRFAGVLTILASGLLAITGCGQQEMRGGLRPGAIAFEPRSDALSHFELRWEGQDWSDARLRIFHRGRPEAAVFETLAGQAFLSAAQGREHVHEVRGSFFIEDSISERCADQRIDAISRQGLGIEMRGRLICASGEAAYRIFFQQDSQHTLRFEAELENTVANRIYWTYASDPDEHFFGFGEQFSHFDLKGKRVPIFVMEQGIGRGRQPLTWLVDLFADSGGDWHTSYVSLPHYLSSRMRSLALENSEYAAFDLRDPDRVQIEVFTPKLAGRILHGDSPLALIREHTRYAGRMRELPDWIHQGAVIGLQGGTARVYEALEALQAQGTPLAAFWLQDWVGPRFTTFGKQLWWNWELDRAHYPDWEALVEDLRAREVRVMLYVNPFLVDAGDKGDHQRNLFREAADQGFLVRRADGEPVMVQITDFSAALLDLTSAPARDWMVDVLHEQLIGVGASGWMADFGEALPCDVELANGVDACREHNRYPERWAEMNRRLVEESLNSDELVFFTRSGYTRTPRYATLHWLGDQLVSWDAHDGIKSSVTGLLSGGISGYSLNHADIGGYTTLDVPLLGVRRSKELMLRWIELAAFQPVFRSHEGNDPGANHQFDSDDETLEHFSRFAKLYAALAPYRKQLVREAARSGAPVVRHPFLLFPQEPATWSMSYQQFWLGSELLVAPVLDPGRTHANVWLPPGRWVLLWSGEVRADLETAGWVRVSAPLGEPAVLYREGSQVGEDLRRRLGELGVLDPDAATAPP